MSKTHWKKLGNNDYIGAWTLYDNEGNKFDMNVTCTSVKMDKVTGDGGRKEDCRVMQLQGQLPFIVNNTNCKTLEKLLGSPNIEDWVGKTFTLYVDNIKVKGEWTDCLRIRKTLPTVQKPELTPQHAQWQTVIDSLKAKTATMDYVLSKFNVSPDNIKILTDASTGV